MAKGFKTGGRKKGTPNKAEEIRQQFFDALKELGGREFIVKTAREEPVALIKIISNLLPKEIEADITGELTVKWEQ
jgi:hypothetical protein